MTYNVLNCLCTFKNKECFIPQRYIMAALACMALIVAYGQRIVLNFAINEIVPRSVSDHIHCRGVRNITEEGLIEGGAMNWGRHQIAWVLGFFYVGYIVGHIPFGLYVDWYGSRQFFSTGILVSTVMVISQPTLINYLPEHCLMASRFVMGIGQSALFPSISVLFARWIPPEERSLVAGFSYSANALGLTIGNLVSGKGIEHLKSWPFAFYFWGMIGMFWYVLFIHYVFSGPESHPFITPNEKALLAEKIKRSNTRLEIPWSNMMRDSAFWGLIFAQIGHDYSMYTQLSSLPRYLTIVPYYDLGMCSVMTSVPYIFQWVTGIISGKIVNYLVNAKKVKVVNCRKFCSTLAILIPPIIMFFVPFRGECNATIINILLCLFCFFKGPISVGVQVNHLDMTRNFPGIVNAIVNAMGAITGLTPIFISWIVIDNTLIEWLQMYGLVLGIAVIGNIVYLFSCTADRRPWDLSPTEVAKP